MLADFTGDGRADPLLRVRDNSNGYCSVGEFATTAADAPAVDRLATIRTPTGLTLQPQYQRSIELGRPISLPVVKELWLRDFPRVVFNRQLSPIIETHRYTFSDNRWDAVAGELLGFRQGWDEIVERISPSAWSTSRMPRAAASPTPSCASAPRPPRS